MYLKVTAAQVQLFDWIEGSSPANLTITMKFLALGLIVSHADAIRANHAFPQRFTSPKRCYVIDEAYEIERVCVRGYQKHS